MKFGSNALAVLSSPPGFTCWISFAPVLYSVLCIVESLSLLCVLFIS